MTSFAVEQLLTGFTVEKGFFAAYGAEVRTYLQPQMRRASTMMPPRVSWDRFPDVLMLAGETALKRHPAYSAEKAGDAAAAQELVLALYDADKAGRLATIIGDRKPMFVSVHAYERDGVNATIPEVLADVLASRFGWPVDAAVVQTNIVSHTGANGFARLARQAAFSGPIGAGGDYVMVDDFVGMGGTLANLRGHIEAAGGKVVAAIALTGKPYSARLALTRERLDELRNKLGDALENWWRERFGHAFDALTESEARYLARTADADAVRNRIAAAEQAGNSP